MKIKEFLKEKGIFEFIDRHRKSIIISLISLVIVIILVVTLIVLYKNGVFSKKDDGSKDVFENITDTTDDEDVFVNAGDLTDIDGRSYGVDVSKWQGLIDWKAVKNTGIQFAIIRIGYRGEDGIIREDEFAKYNLQEAYKNGIMLGVYFFSTAVSEEEVIEEAEWTLNFIEGYSISYPVVYDCEGFRYETSRMYKLTAKERTDIALKYLDMINDNGYDAMFYGARNELWDAECWDIERIDQKYKVWVAIYSKITYPVQDMPEYNRRVDAWQFSNKGNIAGINVDVDLVVCYFKKKTSLPKNPDAIPEEIKDILTDGTYYYTKADDYVTAKYYTNLRSASSLSSNIVVVLENGNYIKRIGISPSGWSMLEYDGQIVFADTAYLVVKKDEPTPDTTTTPETTITPDTTTTPESTDTPDTTNVPESTDIPETTTPSTDNTEKIPTEYEGDYYKVDEQVTAKILTNLRNGPSVNGTEVVHSLKNGEVVKRIGKNDLSGWSMLEYDGKIVYAVTSYLVVYEPAE